MENDQILPVEEKGEIVLYQPDDNVRLEVRLQDDTVWLTQQQMTELFKTTKQNVSLHINNIFREGELTQNSVVKESLTTAGDGKNYRTKYYNLDVIISVGYRVKSPVGTRFRQWANGVLKDYLLRGYAVHQQVMALQQINLRIDAQNDRIARIEGALDQQQQQLDFVVRANEKPEELLIPTGCVWDAYMFVCDLIRETYLSPTVPGSNLQDAFFVKGKAWEYENELRLLAYTPNGSGKYASVDAKNSVAAV